MDKYYNNIKNLLIENEIYNKIKDFSKEKNKVKTYYEIGERLYKAGSKYGDSIIEQYSKKLMIEIGKKYNARTLRRIRQFYILFQNQKWSTLSTISLTWSHYSELLPIKNTNKINYYIDITLKQNLGVRQLRERIKNKEYERLDKRTKKKLMLKEETNVSDFIKNPIILKNSLNYEIVSEKTLQILILEDISSFLKELGEGFCFIDNEYRIKLGNIYNYIDILLYNINFNCYVVIELKITELKKEHIGQIQVYMNYIDKNIKKISQSKTIGIVICKKNNKYVIDYCSDSRILSKEYLLV
ncbi:MAG: DUF1016 family protein [Bacilli bacterium]|nr:DUF1016 family protein [Bacilli bacterium]